jgi:hypothetical protein
VRQRVLLLMPLRLRRRWWYFTAYHRWLRLRHPVAFAEKMNWRMINDRRDLLAVTCDKDASKAFALQRCEGLALRVPKTYWIGTDLAELAAAALPRDWVLKPNHRTGLVILGSGTPDLGELSGQTRGWLDELNWAMLGEWAYSFARRAILVEERIGDSAAVPADYKVLVFDGVPRLIQVIEGRFAEQHQRYYTSDWEALPYESKSQLGPVRPRPPELPLLLEIAGRIGAPFDYMSVDLYISGGEVWFGELTAYSHGGYRASRSPGIDELIGELWALPVLAN